MNRNVVVIALVILVVTGMLVTGKYLSQRSVEGRAGAGATGDAVGAVAPDFQLTSLDGKPLKLSDLRGRAVLLNFWATWCAPCKIEIPWFVDLQKQYGPQGLQVVGVAMDDASKDAIAKFAKEMGVDYPVVIGDDKVADEYGGVQALPTTFYIGRDGKIVGRVFGLIGHGEIEENIQKALKSGQAAAAPAKEPTRSADIGAK